MSRRLQLALVIASLIIVGLSLVALIYVFWPLEGLREQFRLAPTLFVPPAP